MLQVFNQGNRGIASSSGETWEVQRKFTHRTLKNLSKNGRLEQILGEEVADLCSLLRYIILNMSARLRDFCVDHSYMTSGKIPYSTPIDNSGPRRRAAYPLRWGSTSTLPWPT